MSFEFSLPSFQVDTPSEQRMYAYLYQTVQQLNWALKHIATAPVSAAPEVLPNAGAGTPGADYAGADLQELKSLIIKSADIADGIYASISKRLQGAYVAQSAFGTYREATELQLEANAKGISQNYAHIQQLDGNLDAVQQGSQEAQSDLTQLREDMTALHARLSSTNAYIRSGMIAEDEQGLPVYGLEIGQTNEVGGQEVFNKYARFTSSRLSFYDRNDTEVAYISDYKLYITNVQITGSLTVGGYGIDTSDGLAFRWMGGETG
jgi:hypothetical protein